jgi:hypothetical protein
MNIERYVRLISGTLILISIALGHYVSPYWFLLTTFIGANLFQSSLTNKCPLFPILRKLGVNPCGCV